MFLFMRTTASYGASELLGVVFLAVVFESRVLEGPGDLVDAVRVVFDGGQLPQRQLELADEAAVRHLNVQEQVPVPALRDRPRQPVLRPNYAQLAYAEEVFRRRTYVMRACVRVCT
jgi:hypothetical protein